MLVTYIQPAYLIHTIAKSLYKTDRLINTVCCRFRIYCWSRIQSPTWSKRKTVTQLLWWKTPRFPGPNQVTNQTPGPPAHPLGWKSPSWPRHRRIYQPWETSPSRCLRCALPLRRRDLVIETLLKCQPLISLLLPEGQPAWRLRERWKWKDVSDFQHFGTGGFLPWGSSLYFQ